MSSLVNEPNPFFGDSSTILDNSYHLATILIDFPFLRLYLDQILGTSPSHVSIPSESWGDTLFF